jgi:subtilisin
VVAAHDIADPMTYFYNPRPPVEFGAWGVAVPVGWSGGGSTVATGNSFAAPHIAGLLVRLRSMYPDATPFEAKTLLAQGATVAAGWKNGW